MPSLPHVAPRQFPLIHGPHHELRHCCEAAVRAASGLLDHARCRLVVSAGRLGWAVTGRPDKYGMKMFRVARKKIFELREIPAFLALAPVY